MMERSLVGAVHHGGSAHGGRDAGGPAAGAAVSSSGRATGPPSQEPSRPVARGQWRKGKFLGSGAFGQVYLAYDVETGVEFAVKQVFYSGEGGADTSKEVESLEREMKLLKSLRHPRIVQYFDTRRTPEFLAIFME